MLETGAAPEFPEGAAEHGLMLPQVNILYGNKSYVMKDIFGPQCANATLQHQENNEQLPWNGALWHKARFAGLFKIDAAARACA